MRFIDLSNKKFGRLTVIERVETNNKRTTWLCKCDCGNLIKAYGGHLKNGHTKSCGCLKKEVISQQFKKHDETYLKLYKKYRSIIDRTEYKSSKSYKNYGGRGIKLCDEWRNDFMSFYNWAINNGYRDDLTIDRIDVNGNYSPDNCRWVNRYIQANNKRNNVYYEYNQENHTLPEWSRIKNISFSTLRERIKRGLTIEESLTIPIRGNHKKIC